MKTLLANKSLIRTLAVVLAVLLVVALIPQIPTALSDPEAHLEDATLTEMADTGEEGEEEQVIVEPDENENPGEIIDEDKITEAAMAEWMTQNGGVMPMAVIDDDEDDDDPNAGIDMQTEKIAITAAQAMQVGKIESDQKVDGDLSYTSGTNELTVDGDLNGHITVSGSSTVLTINGDGFITGDKSRSVIIVKNGAKLIFDGPTVSNGYGSHTAKIDELGLGSVGGGILVARENSGNAKLVLRSGTITANSADTGGGIFIDYTCGFTMSGGTVSYNTADYHEGGGIFFLGTKDGNGNGSAGVISGGDILYNKTMTTTDWGGGGIFINSGSKLSIESALITENMARGLGGGVSGCPHAEISIGEIANGAALFKNQSQVNENGEAVTAIGWPISNGLTALSTPSVVLSGTNIGAGDFLLKGLGAGKTHVYNGITTSFVSGVYASDKFDSSLAKDYYCTKSSVVSATNLGSDGYSWEGFVASIPATSLKDDKTVTQDKVIAEKIKVEINEPYAAPDASLGLTSMATSDNSGYEKRVTIQGNYSNTHGGGIGCNGTISFGTYRSSKIVNPYSIMISKELVNSTSGKKLSFNEGDFAFQLKTGNTVYTATNDAKGNVWFTGIPGYDSTGDKTVQFTLTETPKNGYTSCIPASGVTINVALNVTQKNATTALASGSSQVTNTFDTTVTNVAVEGTMPNGMASSDGVLSVRNTLNLKTSFAIPVAKTTSNLTAGSYTFERVEVDAPATPTQTSFNTLVQKANTSATATINTVDSTSAIQTASSAFDAIEYTQQGQYWYVVSEQTDSSSKTTDYDNAVYLVKINVAEINNGYGLGATVAGVWKADSKEEPFKEVDLTEKSAFDSANTPAFTNVGVDYRGFNLQLQKKVLTLLEGSETTLDRDTFTFTLTDVTDPANRIVLNEQTTDGTGAATFTIASKEYAKKAYESATNTYEGTFELTETVPTETGFMQYIEPTTIKIVFGCTVQGRQTVDGITKYMVEPTINSISVVTPEGVTDFDVKASKTNDIWVVSVANRYVQNGEWSFGVDKFYYGNVENKEFTFTMVELAASPFAKTAQPLADEVPLTVPTTPLEPSVATQGKWTATTNVYENHHANMTFGPVDYVVVNQNRDDRGTHWYLITEDGAIDQNGNAVPGMDSTVYLVQVTVQPDAAPSDGKVSRNLVSEVTGLWYADDMAAYEKGELHAMATTDKPAFYNTDNTMAFAMASYSVYAASGEAVDQVCYVDPKLIKNLEGRSIKTDEFSFELREVPQDAVDDFYKYNSEGKLVLNTDGPVISATSNDEFGMVDFDKANNQAGEGFEPSCLKYTQPGTYHYVVVETDGMKDASVVYNPAGDVITFTTEIVLDEATGKLECVNMYYGHLDSATGKNVPYADQYTEGNTAEPGSRAAFANLNMDWHPTITNVVKPMDLQVRKTSVSDRTEGLEGATYGLYMVNDNKEGDILLASETSDENGWITFRDVSLTENTLYYFKEIAAPAGHTVSEFRSSYFKVVETKDEAGTTYYKLEYQDSKYAGTDAGTVDDEPLATPMALALDEEGAEGAGAEAAEGEPVEAAENAEAAEPAEAGSNLTASAAADGVTYDKDTGNLLLTYALDGGVYDEVTDVSFNKLDTRTHEWVSGAKLAIIEKDSGAEMISWVSGEESKQVQKTLNVGTTYILRELEAPANYRKAGDVEFVIDNYGKVEILNGTDNGNAELSDSTITLYDTMLDAEEVETQERTNIIQRLAQTGDPMLLGGLGVVAVAALALMVLAAYRRRKTHEE